MFANTLIRVADDFVTEMHIDTDEANASGISFQTSGELIINDTRKEANIVARHNMTLGEYGGTSEQD